MLSRFSKSKLPGLQALLSSGSVLYAQSDLDSAISQIKILGKREVNNSDECLRDIEKILAMMKKFSHSIQVQRVGCHALSNLAMHVVAARYIIQKNGFKVIRKAIDRFINDHKLCWLASSAIWNLARPPTNRSIIGEDGVKLMFNILKQHVEREKVCNTAIGALSNLSLQDGLKDRIARPENLDVIICALRTHLKLRSLSVMTSGAGLLANLAVNDDHASVLTKKNCLAILMDLLTWNISKTDDTKSNNAQNNHDETLFRNTCAAMNNLVTADGFLDSFLLNLGIEKVFKFLKVYSDNELYMSLLENCLINIDCDSSKETTSFHLACYHGKQDIFKSLYTQFRHEFDLDSTDAHNMTVLDYAITKEHKEIVQLLARCGAKKYTTKEQSVPDTMKEAMTQAKNELSDIKMANQKALIQALPHVPVDLCKYMLNFQHNIDMLQGMQAF